MPPLRSALPCCYCSGPIILVTDSLSGMRRSRLSAARAKEHLLFGTWSQGEETAIPASLRSARTSSRDRFASAASAATFSRILGIAAPQTPFPARADCSARTPGDRRPPWSPDTPHLFTRPGRRAGGRRARRRAGAERRSTPGGCSGRWSPRRGGGRSASGARAQPRRDGSGQGNPSSPPQAFDPRVAGFGDPDLEAVEAGLELAVRRDPDDEGIDQEGAAGAGRLLRHPADGLLGDPEPDLVAGGAELGPEPEGPVRFPGWARARSGFSPRRASPRASPR